MSVRVTDNTGALLEFWDDAARTYTDNRVTPPVVRAYTADENARAAAEAAGVTSSTNEADLIAKGAAALAANVAYLALVAPTNAQVAAQVVALTKQVNALLRLVTRRLSATDGT